MALTNAQMTGLEAAILAYLAAGGRFARTVAAFKEEMQVENDPLVVSGTRQQSVHGSREWQNKRN